MYRTEIARTETLVLFGFVMDDESGMSMPEGFYDFYWLATEVGGDEINLGHFLTLADAREAFEQAQEED